MLLKFIQLCLIFILIGGGFILYKQPDLRNMALQHVAKIPYITKLPSSIPVLKDVKGINTTKFSSVTGQLRSDVNDGVDVSKKQIMNLKIGDVMNFLNRGQKITKDFRGFQDYVKNEVGNFLKGKM